jgi:hypothetical protein
MEEKNITALVVVTFVFTVIAVVLVIAAVSQNVSKEETEQEKRPIIYKAGKGINISTNHNISQTFSKGVRVLANTTEDEKVVQSSAKISSGGIMLGLNDSVSSPSRPYEILAMVDGKPEWKASIGNQPYLSVAAVMHDWWVVQEEGAFLDVDGPDTKDCQWIGRSVEPEDESEDDPEYGYGDYAFTIIGQVTTASESVYGSMQFAVKHFIPLDYQVPDEGKYNNNSVCVASMGQELVPCECIHSESLKYITLRFTKNVVTHTIPAGTLIQFKADIVMRLQLRNPA